MTTLPYFSLSASVELLQFFYLFWTNLGDVEGDLFCPVPIVGTRCPDSSVFHYYKCCGDLNKDCCFNLQVSLGLLVKIRYRKFYSSRILKSSQSVNFYDYVIQWILPLEGQQDRRSGFTNGLY
ncbi:unnamed protein product [Heligmosomoides polygyrus]|uniref:WAP domain-containing protein n=1 Tax=Heligmosomoides polygyrus TaxID=6339 RepID=A0A183FSY0_HELPZ|nr:unnamed protein product [Heligmosomoides polygyrus]